MAAKVDNNEEESFIILGSSPGTSLDIKFNGITMNGDISIDKTQIEEALKELSIDAGMAFKAQFQLGDNPSPSSMMIASNIVSEDKSTEELQKKFGEIIDENILLKETLKQNNDSMKEQFLLIASCQEDMMETHKMHKEKFDETRELVEKLRAENKKLKLDMTKLTDGSSSLLKSQINGETAEPGEPVKTAQSSVVYEFVTSPDDDTMYKLTAQLELVEKQRRQVIVENDKLTWQKESLENIVDATWKERDDLKEKLKNIELHYSNKEQELLLEINTLKGMVQQLESKLASASSVNNVSGDEVKKRDVAIQHLESKIIKLQGELKTAQLKILDLENIKLEYTKQKSSNNETIRVYKEQIQDLQNRLKEAQTTVFQPIRFSISSEPENTGSEFSSLISNVKLYDKTLKHLSELLNSITHGTSEGILKTMDLVFKLQEYKLERAASDRVKGGILDIKQSLETQHSAALNYIGQIRGTLSIFESIFQDYKEILKKGLTKSETAVSPPMNIVALTEALTARGSELQVALQEIDKLRSLLSATTKDGDVIEVLKYQIDAYKSDFEAERAAREKMASDKENALADLRSTQKRIQMLTEQLNEVQRSNPSLYAAITANKSPAKAPPRAVKKSTPTSGSSGNTSSGSTGNMVYKCPKCMRFSSDQYKVMEEHFDFCLDDF